MDEDVPERRDMSTMELLEWRKLQQSIPGYLAGARKFLVREGTLSNSEVTDLTESSSRKKRSSRKGKGPEQNPRLADGDLQRLATQVAEEEALQELSQRTQPVAAGTPYQSQNLQQGSGEFKSPLNYTPSTGIGLKQPSKPDQLHKSLDNSMIGLGPSHHETQQHSISTSDTMDIIQEEQGNYPQMPSAREPWDIDLPDV